MEFDGVNFGNDQFGLGGIPSIRHRHPSSHQLSVVNNQASKNCSRGWGNAGTNWQCTGGTPDWFDRGVVQYARDPYAYHPDAYQRPYVSGIDRRVLGEMVRDSTIRPSYAREGATEYMRPPNNLCSPSPSPSPSPSICVDRDQTNRTLMMVFIFIIIMVVVFVTVMNTQMKNLERILESFRDNIKKKEVEKVSETKT
jgi:hypothetical protein